MLSETRAELSNVQNADSRDLGATQPFDLPPALEAVRSAKRSHSRPVMSDPSELSHKLASRSIDFSNLRGDGKAFYKANNATRNSKM